MIRTLTTAAIAAAAVSAPALAETATKLDPSKAATFSAELSNASAAGQAQRQLASQGYTQISELNRDANGHWVGTAQKDGKTVYVSVVMPHASK